MLAGKNHTIRQCLNLTLIVVLAIAIAFANQANVLAASPKVLKVVSHKVMKRTPGPNGVAPNTCDLSAGCVGLSGSLTGVLTALPGSATFAPTLTGADQNVPFNFPVVVDDSRATGTNSGWTLNAASAGLTVPSVVGGAASTTTTPFTLTSSTTAACTDATAVSCTNPTGVTINPGSIPSTGGNNYAVVAGTARDIGTTTINTAGTVPIGANTIAGTYNGTITVTVSPSV